MKFSYLSTATAAALLIGSSAYAQSAFDGTDVATSANEEIRETIADDFDTSREAFGNEGRKLGFSSSVALRASGTTGNTETGNLGIAADFGYFDGVNGYTLELNYELSTSATDGDDEQENSLFFDAEYTRAFANPDLYGFVKLQGSVDRFSSTEDDYFLGFGLGYRIIDNATTAWSVQGGPGYRFASLSDATANNEEEAAFAISSDFSHQLTESVFFTNDTDIVGSDFNTTIVNDLGFTVALASNLALRTSLLSEYSSEVDAGFAATDHSFGTSLVFNY